MDSPGNVGAVTQTNSSQSTAGAGGGTAPGASQAGNTQGGGTGDAASSTATAGTTQSSPDNSNVEVRVGSKGNDQPVQQTNSSGADAQATGPTGGGGAGSSGGTASATADQTAPSNVDVTIRVGSGGSNGPVNQTNSSTATAGSTTQSGGATTTPAAGSGNAGTDQTTTTAGSSEADNSSTAGQTSTQVTGDGAPPDGTTVAGSQDAPQSGGSTTGTATAGQTDASNVHVSVRVGSPGPDAPVDQANIVAAAGTGPGLGIVTTTAGSNVDVSVEIPGPTKGAPGGDWVWNWTWTGDWTPGAGAQGPDVAPTDGSTWTWEWTTPPPADGPSTTQSGDSTGQAATGPQPAQGTWTWTWTWVLPNGQTWTGGWVVPCDCNWSWNWTWDWSTGAPGTGAPPPTGNGVDTTDTGDDTSDGGSDSIGAVTQENSVTATATAGVGADTTQSFDQSQTGGDPQLGNQLQSAEQDLSSSQSALAVADAAQAGALNLIQRNGIPTGVIAQANTVSALAAAQVTAIIGQTTVQRQTGSATDVQVASATQSLANAQAADAAADATQSGAYNVVRISSHGQTHGTLGWIEQTNSAAATATATVEANLTQWVGQYQDAGVADSQEEVAIQALGNAQASSAASIVAQMSTGNVADVVVPSGSHAQNPTLRQWNDVFTTSAATDSSDALQSILQMQGGGDGTEIAAAEQNLDVTQSAAASSPAEQQDLLNRSGWLGVEPQPGQSGQPPAPVGSSLPPPDQTVDSTPPGVVWTDFPPTAPFLPWRVGPGTVVAIVRAPYAQAAFTRPGLMLPASSSGSSASEPGAPAAGGTVDRSSTTATFVGAGGISGAGGAGSAAHGGGPGPSGALGRLFKLVAPAHLGPQSQAPTLGRSVAFLDPLERPG